MLLCHSGKANFYSIVVKSVYTIIKPISHLNCIDEAMQSYSLCTGLISSMCLQRVLNNSNSSFNQQV